jgi:hypothetical protein
MLKNKLELEEVQMEIKSSGSEPIGNNEGRKEV